MYPLALNIRSTGTDEALILKVSSIILYNSVEGWKQWLHRCHVFLIENYRYYFSKISNNLITCGNKTCCWGVGRLTLFSIFPSTTWMQSINKWNRKAPANLLQSYLWYKSWKVYTKVFFHVQSKTFVGISYSCFFHGKCKFHRKWWPVFSNMV